MDIAIEEFFNDRKAKSLKKNITSGMDELQLREVNLKADEEFHMSNWLPDASRRAGQISLSSHPCTFSHPSGRKNKNGKTTTVISEVVENVDGLIRSGNLQVPLDALGNAAALDVYKFLTLELSDGLQLIDHIEQDTELAVSLLTIPGSSYQELKAGFMAMKESEPASITSSKIKQIYFPVSDSYHQLSVLTPSGVMYEFRNRMQAMRFGEATSLAKECRRRNEVNATGFDDIYGLAMIGYGGTKPQNISVLNSQYGGKAYLLQSLPPSLELEEVRLPTTHFFTDCLWPNQFKLSFELLHKWLVDSRNNIQMRNRRDEILLDVFNEIIQKVWQIRSVEPGWSLRNRFDRLPKPQKILLDEHWRAERNDNDQCMGIFLKDMARWIVMAYKKVLGTHALPLNDDELRYVYMLIDEQKEALL